MQRSAQPTFIYRGHGLGFCVYPDCLTITADDGEAATSATYDLRCLRDITSDPPAHLVLTLAEGERIRVPLGRAVERARDALVRELQPGGRVRAYRMRTIRVRWPRCRAVRADRHGNAGSAQPPVL